MDTLITILVKLSQNNPTLLYLVICLIIPFGIIYFGIYVKQKTLHFRKSKIEVLKDLSFYLENKKKLEAEQIFFFYFNVIIKFSEIKYISKRVHPSKLIFHRKRTLGIVEFTGHEYELKKKINLLRKIKIYKILYFLTVIPICAPIILFFFKLISLKGLIILLPIVLYSVFLAYMMLSFYGMYYSAKQLIDKNYQG